MDAGISGKTTTIKLQKSTKDRLDHLKEFERESYDEILKKMLYILNAMRNSSGSAITMLKRIDKNIKRKQVYSDKPRRTPEKQVIMRKNEN